ncbi:tyrosine-type recombinase/integrase [Roseococcus pinisoli]|uniref:Site-specific integrase n=1 Tax=Roseococcus pinisoli TaxID=2835040 RepID=A0ABS5QF22_9PROT|nr:site-specific integrase [Roseococcus pinisoli]MBS7812292.1 site-specific integrase [Roseococcus pinisoli]
MEVEQAKEERDAWANSLRKKAAKSVAAQAKALKAGPSVLWEDVVEAAIGHAEGSGLKPATLKRYRSSLDTIDPLLRGERVDTITMKRLHRLVKERRQPRVVMVAGKEKGFDTPTNATINRDLSAVSLVLEYAVMEGLVDVNHARLISRKKVTKEVRDPKEIPSDEDIATFLKQASPEFANLVRFLVETGCRLLEGVCAQMPDQSLEGAHPFVMVRHTKSNQPRMLRVHPDTAAWLRELPRTTKTVEFPKETATGKAMKGIPVFWHGRPEDPLPFQNASSNIAQYGKRIEGAVPGYRHFGAHALRHRFAHRKLEEGADLFLLQQHMGHSSIKVTEGYLKTINVAKREAALMGAVGLPVTTLPFKPKG